MFESKKLPWELADGGSVRFQQKRGGRRVRIAINKGGVDYEIKDINGENHFHVVYEQIDPETSRIVEKNGWLLRFGILWAILGVVLSILGGRESIPVSAVLVLFGTASVFYYFWRKATFSVLRTERGRISIIEDKWHDDILRELNLKRVSVLRSKYLQIDHDNSPKSEIGKYNWLRRVGAITDVELSQFTSMLQGDADVQTSSIQPPTISLN
jgi:hypothetical protein